ncbi:hypothetical protein ASPFODRAFT_445816 [Aspergillus luchuensis CBS 106.47]|uniref:Uncharacterized protein n=1 Tax=Aspergillus luchuensis (strain CBS 106.47) TaxID=1137211 RepID=A0A1M3TWM6_ASPLC|nr:hypothetical protein ASPFODRAFT_445816 [Aspergillus luchuensis CBS 106.47]
MNNHVPQHLIGSGVIERRGLECNHSLLAIKRETTHYMILVSKRSSTYDHRVWKTGLPVRSAVLKPHAGRLVVGWVTTSESLLLYVFLPLLLFFHLTTYLLLAN